MHFNPFNNLALNQAILRALAQEGYQKPTPIQRTAIPAVLAAKDLLATAQTGTCKTAAFQIAKLAKSILKHPETIEVTPAASVAGTIDQKVLFVEQAHKRALLNEMLKGEHVLRALVFTRTKHRADRIQRQLSNSGISADVIHANKNQNARHLALAAFGQGKVKVLVATDIVARGIDVDGISHVFNYELPHDAEDYIHRIGRTARAGAVGTALSFCGAEEISLLKAIEKLTLNPISAFEDHPFHSAAIAALRQPPFRPGHTSGRGTGGTPLI